MIVNSKKLWGCVGSLVLVITGIWHLNHLQPVENKVSKNKSSYNFPKRQMDVRGFDYRGVQNEKTVLAIKADRFSSHKKRLGPFRIGLFKEVTFDNAVFEIYEYDISQGMPDKNLETAGLKLYSSGENSIYPIYRHIQSNTKNANYGNWLSGEIFQNFPIKGITGINASPIKIQFYRNELVISELSADRGFFDIVKNSVILKGNAKAICGDRTMFAEQLILNPKKSLITAEQIISYNLQEQAPPEARLVMDNRLNVILKPD